MAYADYINAATLQDACDADTNDTPGMAADARFIGQSEEATTAVANRPHRALAINMDNLKIPLDNQIALPQVGALTAFSGNTIDIDPTGGAAGDINYTGYLYMGNASYAPATQEDFNTLFQFLDEDYNEVTVAGAEVVVSAVSVGPALGSGFYNSGVVTLTLSASVPSGNYRLAYARETTLAELPNDALIRADIRGLHEAAAESEYKRTIIVAADTSFGPADYVGASALEDALTALEPGGSVDIFVRGGVYDFSAAYTFAGNGHIRVIGQSTEGAAGSPTFVNLTGGAWDLTINADHVEFQNLVIATLQGNGVRWNGDYGRAINVLVETGELDLTGDYFVGEQMRIAPKPATTSTSVGLRLDGANNASFRNCNIDVNETALYVTNLCRRVTVEGCTFQSDDATCMDIQGSLADSSFTACYFEAADGLALYIDQGALQQTSFVSCEFQSTPDTVASLGVVDCFVPAAGNTTQLEATFSGCRFETLLGAARYRNPAVRLVSIEGNSLASYRIRLINCEITDRGCAHEDGAGGGVPGVYLRGVYIEDTRFDFSYQAAMIEDGPVLEAWDCYGLRCHVVVEVATITNVAISSAGAVELYRGCEFHDLRLSYGAEEWSRPFLYIQGDSSAPSMAIDGLSPTERRSIVDGLEVLGSYELGITHWHNTTADSPLVAHVHSFGVLRNFRWPRTNMAGLRLTSSGQPDSLIRISGSNAEVTDCHIELDAGIGAPGAPYLQHCIAIHGDTTSGIRIERNCLAHNTGRDPDADMGAMIYVDGPTVGRGTIGGVIADNKLVWVGDASPSVNTEALISCENFVYGWRIINNHIEVWDLSGSGILVYWNPTDATWPTNMWGEAPLTGSQGGGLIAQGNILYNRDLGGVMPAIVRASGVYTDIVGIADNVIGTD